MDEAVLHKVYDAETLYWVEVGKVWIGNVFRFDERWRASIPGEPWNVEIGEAASRQGAVRLLVERSAADG